MPVKFGEGDATTDVTVTIKGTYEDTAFTGNAAEIAAVTVDDHTLAFTKASTIGLSGFTATLEAEAADLSEVTAMGTLTITGEGTLDSRTVTLVAD